ncbi:MAG TPA: CHAT domain-containing protein [Oscillatoriales cyanobacterium M59_W2019_021]|nr:CHAT domain-containing protein [Oscillatoriales cyanobacterium M59_W2019_021]
MTAIDRGKVNNRVAIFLDGDDMKRYLFFAVMAVLGFLLSWGWTFLPDGGFEKPAWGTEVVRWRSIDAVALPTLSHPSWGMGSVEEIEIAQNARSNHQAAINRGRQLYDAGDFQAAVEAWQAIADAESGIGRSIALSNLSLCWQKLGRWEEAAAAVEESALLLRSLDAGENSERSRVLAQTLEIQGELEYETGRFDVALDRWQEAMALYEAMGDLSAGLRSQLDSIRALQALGLYRRAERVLTEVAAMLPDFPDSELKARGYQHLSYVLRLLGKFGELPDGLAGNCRQVSTDLTDLPDSAIEAGLWSLRVARHLPDAETLHQAQFGLANIARAIYQTQKDLDDATLAETAAETALACYQQAATSTVEATQLRANLNLLSLSIDLAERGRERSDVRVSKAVRDRLFTQIDRTSSLVREIDALPPGRTTIYARLDLAQSLMKVDRLPESEALLLGAANQSQTLGDPRVQSYSLGYLGQLYERRQEWDKAQQHTETALLAAQSIQAGDISYQWQWQLGRILQRQSQPEGAIAAYDGAINTLKLLRRDLVAVSQDVQFDFRDRVEPVYREYVALLLQPETPPLDNLKRARDAIEELQLAELDNFFRDACTEAKPQTLDRIDPEAVAIYNIVLDDRLEVIARLPGADDNNLFHYRTRIPKADRVKVLQDLRTQLQLPYAYYKIKQLSQQAYQWLIEPLEPHLQGDETLVFVLDGEWRNISMAALYDGERYLIEKHPIAIQPSFQLLDPQPLSQPLKGLAAGLSGYPGWPYLPNIGSELDEIENAGVNIDRFLDDNFTRANLEAQLRSQSFNVVHLATHGQFSSQSEKTFILAADGPITLKQLDNLLRSRDLSQAKSVDLLVLTACQTAEGDDRAILGLAGVAVRVGARSTVASLWSLQDKSVPELIGNFYQNLTAGLSRAEALRQAQLAFIAQKNVRDAPLHWAPYVLVGDWR